MPVDCGVVENRKQPFLIACVYKFPNQIPSAGMGRVKVAQTFCIVQGKAVMMTGCEGYVLHTRFFSGAGDFFCVKICCGESICKLGIFFSGHSRAVHNPFSLTELGVESVMDKHAKAHVFKISDAFFRYWYHICVSFSIAA